MPTCQKIVERLTKTKRKFDVCDNWRHAILYCQSCGDKLGEFDMFYDSHESHKFCAKCVSKYIKKTPFDINKSITVLEDNGTTIVIRYEQLRQEEYKQCYFSSKGRYIKIKGKRHYI